MLVHHLTGTAARRNARDAQIFMPRVAKRIATRIQLTALDTRLISDPSKTLSIAILITPY